MVTKLKKILDKRGIMQKWLATEVGVSPNMVTNWVHGSSVPRWDHQCKIRDALKLDTVEDFME